MAPSSIPRPGGRRFVTDGGLETDLIHHHGAHLPAFAAFPLLEDDDGRALLRAYYEEYADIARRAGAGLMLETPTWRANPDWGFDLGYDRRALDRVNQAAVQLLAEVREAAEGVDDVVVGGVIGPRGDGYLPAERMHPDEAAAYHASQAHSFAVAGADAAEDLDDGDPAELAQATRRLEDRLPDLVVLGGCCGTDSRHVAAMWGLVPAR